VLKELPKKTERIEWCEMTTHQRNIYNDALNRSRKTIFDLESEASTPGTETPPVNGRVKPLKKPKAPRTKDRMYLENSSNVLMDLRKAASHPMLFRTRYTDQALDAITKVLLREADFKKRGAVAQYVKEDMEVMTDAELQVFLGSYLVRRMASKWFKCSLASFSRPKNSCRTRTVTSRQARFKHFYDC
jgi:SWI/SNF-related matrix-associated actin-dependent regulator of chromatin subfamily A containing DEAD/H box 1